MNRAQMIEKAVQSLSDACHEGREVFDWDVAAEVVVDAILPQVTTVEELEALPVGSVCIDDDGQVMQVTTLPIGNPDVRGYRSSNGATRFAAVIIQTVALPLTVVWRP